MLLCLETLKRIIKIVLMPIRKPDQINNQKNKIMDGWNQSNIIIYIDK